MTNTTAPNIIDGKFKDNGPLATVEKIKGILQENGISTVENWHQTCVPYCFSLSVQIPGTIFSVNGKGLTREFALASAYGELMERLQMGFVNGPNVQKSGDFFFDSTKYQLVSGQELLAQNQKWYIQLSERYKHLTGITMAPEEIVSQYCDKDGLLSATAYWCLTTGTQEYLPTDMRKRIYATNGCAAGNSPEEAIVQAISETVERNHQTRIVDESLALPDIPEAVLKKYEVAYNIISFVRDNGYKVIIKDASLGTEFPVVCACIIDQKTGKYHTNFGAYPIFEIALERSLTESFQGHSIDNIAVVEDFLIKPQGAYSITSIINEMTLGTWSKSPQFFVGKSSYTFDENGYMKGENNKELLRQCIDYFAKQGFDVLVRDRSCLGFPTYQVIIPGYSEMLIHRLSQKNDDHRYAFYAMRTLRDPVSASMQDMLGLLMHIDKMNQFGSNIRGMHGFLRGAKLSAQLSKAEENYYMSAALGYTYWTLGRQKDAISCLNGMIPEAKPEDVRYLSCLRQYLTLKNHKCAPEQIQQILEMFHLPEAIQWLQDCLGAKRNPFEAFILRCDLKCNENCKIYAKCMEKRARELTAMLDEKSKKLDFRALQSL